MGLLKRQVNGVQVRVLCMAGSKAVQGPATRHRRGDVVARAIDVLDEHGLDDWSMRRLAADLGVQPSALYHHFAGKDQLLAAVAGEIIRRGRRPAEVVAWDAELDLHCVELRDAIRRHRDGAALIARVHGSDAEALERPMRSALERAGADAHLASVGARSLVRFVLSHEDDDPTDFALGLGLLLDGLRRRITSST
jgi:TetR/AcrR family transcriptional regulator, tetracycline repressor protein